MRVFPVVEEIYAGASEIGDAVIHLRIIEAGIGDLQHSEGGEAHLFRVTSVANSSPHRGRTHQDPSLKFKLLKVCITTMSHLFLAPVPLSWTKVDLMT